MPGTASRFIPLKRAGAYPTTTGIRQLAQVLTEPACTSPVITYWTKLGERFVVNYINERDGCHVLVTTQRGERLFDAVLAAGQSAAVSIPRAAGEAPVRIVLSDASGYLDIAEPPAAVSTQ